MLDKTNYKTIRTDLTEVELAALIKVRDGLTSGAIRESDFNMNQIACGTQGCIGGWMAVFMGKTAEEIFQFVSEETRFSELFYPSDSTMDEAGPTDGAQAIDNFLMGDKFPWEFME